MRAPTQHSITYMAGARPHGGCLTCKMHFRCLPRGLNERDTVRVEGLLQNRRQLKCGEYLYQAGDRCDTIYAVKTGCLKTHVCDEHGYEQVTGFQMAGDLLGMDGIGLRAHDFNLVALEDSEVCALPAARLDELPPELETIRRYLHEVMSGYIVRDHNAMIMLSKMRAEERLAAFLLDLSRRFAALGYSSSEFNLRMSREDIGSYLGIKIETVSRMFSQFQERKLIDVKNRHVCILDSVRLQRIIGRSLPSKQRRVG